jgi:hypothetical protein
VSKTNINSGGTQAEQQAPAPDLIEERDGVTSDKSAPVNGAAPLSNGHGDGYKLNGAHEAGGALPVETGQDEAQADSGNLRGDYPCTDSDDAGDTGEASVRKTDGEELPKKETDSKLEQLLSYAARDWYLFPCHYIREDGTCSCGKPDCKSKGKHPLTRHGVKDATCDAVQIEKWHRAAPDANLALACGPSKLLVIDKDQKPHEGKDGAKAWAKLQAEHEPAPETLTQITGSGGEHLLFDRSGYEGKIGSWQGADGLDGRADGGYIVAAPSRNAEGPYVWKDPGARVTPAPEWLVEWATNGRGEGKKKSKANNKAVVKKANRADVKPVNQPVDYSVGHDEEARAISALKALPQSICDARGFWCDFGWGNVNAALYESGLPNARALGDEWSQGSTAYGGVHDFGGPSDPSLYSQAEQDRLWKSFERSQTKATAKDLPIGMA